MRLGTDWVLLTAAVRFQRVLNLGEVEQAIAGLEHSIRMAVPVHPAPLPRIGRTPPTHSAGHALTSDTWHDTPQMAAQQRKRTP
jgi:hypothetical protein